MLIKVIAVKYGCLDGTLHRLSPRGMSSIQIVPYPKVAVIPVAITNEVAIAGLRGLKVQVLCPPNWETVQLLMINWVVVQTVFEILASAEKNQ